MRLHVTYPGSGPHEVELLGRVSIVGRDPSCDLVIHDVKCSRRHAVLETGPDGVTVRDSGSANGVYLNGQRIERTILKPGDLLTLGEVQIQLLPEAVEATMLASADNMATISPGQMAGLTAPAPTPDGATSAAPVAAAAPPPPPPAPVVAAPPPVAAAPPPAAPGGGSYSISGQTDSGKLRADAVKSEMAAMEAREREKAAAAAAEVAAVPAEPAGPRPLTVTLLAVLWVASVLMYLGYGIFGVVKLGGIPGIVTAVVCAFVALIAAVMALGLFMVKPWARILQIVIAGIGLFTCSFTLASAVTIFYMLRAGVKARFAGSGNGDEKEGLFAALLLGTVLLGAIAAGGGMYMASMRMAAAPPFPQP